MAYNIAGVGVLGWVSEEQQSPGQGEHSSSPPDGPGPSLKGQGKTLGYRWSGLAVSSPGPMGQFEQVGACSLRGPACQWFYSGLGEAAIDEVWYATPSFLPPSLFATSLPCNRANIWFFLRPMGHN
jgi:hypothetical protein